jgi:hypothetical protein
MNWGLALLVYNAVSLGNWWCNITFQKSGVFNHTSVKTSRLLWYELDITFFELLIISFTQLQINYIKSHLFWNLQACWISLCSDLTCSFNMYGHYMQIFHILKMSFNVPYFGWFFHDLLWRYEIEVLAVGNMKIWISGIWYHVALQTYAKISKELAVSETLYRTSHSRRP